MAWSPHSMVQADTEYIPEEIAGFYQEAHDAYSIGAYRAVLLFSRSVIEATAKLKEVGGSNLVKKIDNLHEEGHIRIRVKQVAHRYGTWVTTSPTETSQTRQRQRTRKMCSSLRA